jgi:hypothetical protein
VAEFSINGSVLGTPLQDLLMSDSITPGADASYQLCKTIYLWHPIGAKMASSPVKKAQALPRVISVPNSPEEAVRDAFLEEWDTIGAETIIRNVMTQCRVYGIASLAVLNEDGDSAKPLDLKKIADQEIAFNVLDPLNTSGSLVLNQNPNAFDFQKHRAITVSGQAYNRNRTVTVMNEEPIYIAYTQAAFGFVGRSVYQRALFPLKSFVQTMVADDLLALKVGLLIAKLKPPGSIADRVMSVMMGVKRALLKEAQTGQVLSINIDEAIESLNLQNMNGSLVTARKDILENIAAAADMPAKLLNNETFAEGFGEGTEDAKAVAEYANTIRRDMLPLYRFMDRIVQHRAWNKRFYETIQAKFADEYGGMSYESALYRWMNSFKAEWPSLLQEPESEQIKVEQVKYQTVVSTAQVLLPEVDPENKASVIEWMQDNINENTKLFTSPLNLDFDALRSYTPPQSEESGLEEPKPGKPHISAGDATIAPVEGRVKKIEDFLRGRRHVDA